MENCVFCKEISSYAREQKNKVKKNQPFKNLQKYKLSD